MTSTETKIRASIVRRACEHVSLRDCKDRELLAERHIEAIREQYPELPNWRQVLRLVEAVAACPAGWEASPG